MPVGAFRLTLAPREACWVSVRSNGTSVFSGLMRAGERKELTLQGDVSLTVGNAGAFAYFINDQPGRALGGPGQVATVRAQRREPRRPSSSRGKRMDAAYRTPLVDCFRRGDVARDVRLLAAAGGVAPRAHEQVALLMLLVDDSDPEVAATASATLARLPAGPLAAFLARADVSSEVRAFFGARGVTPAEQPAEKSDAPLLEDVSSATAAGAAVEEASATAGDAAVAPAAAGEDVAEGHGAAPGVAHGRPSA